MLNLGLSSMEAKSVLSSGAQPEGSGPVVRILGIRGLPASHGGFETFAQNFAFHLRDRGWKVIVYCQDCGTGPVREDVWEGIHRVSIPVRGKGSAATMVFDWKSTLHAARHRDLCLTLGYNTALFSIVYKLKGVPSVFNMDGIEWSRAKWPLPVRVWLFANEVAGCWLADHLVADHPEIAVHLAKRVRREKITTIPYGSSCVEAADPAILGELGLEPNRYGIVIARPEPENSVAEIVEAWSLRPRGQKLVVLGKYLETEAYHQKVRRLASSEVLFPGAIYDKRKVEALRLFSRFYAHGHQVGGTNPSLVEALGCGNAVLAHDNRFNRWVAEKSALYFKDVTTCAAEMDAILADDTLVAHLRDVAARRHREQFTFDTIHYTYEEMLRDWLPKETPAR